MDPRLRRIFLAKEPLMKLICHLLFLLSVAFLLTACPGGSQEVSAPGSGSLAAAGSSTGAGSPAAAGSPPVVGSIVLETEEQKLLYALGLNAGERLSSLSLNDEELAYVQAGIGDRALQRDVLINELQYAHQISPYVQQRIRQTVALEPARSAEFVAMMAGQPGAQASATGMVYFELVPGSGASPTAESTVVVHYTGRQRDGTIFDNSYLRGEPSTIALGEVIACWSEGVQRMKVGGKSRLVCPASTAYGNDGSPKVLPGAALLFEIELLDIPASVAAEPAGD
jgi:FKBP-type peptidyl-prolyl cis-trans isomerase FkpA